MIGAELPNAMTALQPGQVIGCLPSGAERLLFDLAMLTEPETGLRSARDED